MPQILAEKIADLICAEGKIDNMPSRKDLDKCANRKEHMQLAIRIIATIKYELDN